MAGWGHVHRGSIAEMGCIWPGWGVLRVPHILKRLLCPPPSPQVRPRKAAISKSSEPVAVPKVPHSELHLLQLFSQSPGPLPGRLGQRPGLVGALSLRQEGGRARPSAMEGERGGQEGQDGDVDT